MSNLTLSSRGWPGPLLTAGLILLTVLAAALPRVLSPQLSRPFEQDEIVTLGSTSAGMFDTVQELQARPRHNVKEVVLGFIRPFAGRWDPNYHIVHSWALSVSTFFTGYSEPAVRLPALLAFLASVALLQWLVWDTARSRLLMVLTGAAYAALPFSWQFSLSARGYSMMMLMVLMQLALLRPLFWRKLGANWIFCAISLLNILNFLNTASMLIMWLAPFSFAVFLMPRPGAEEVESGPNAALLRERWLLGYRALWAQFAGLGFVACAMFLLCKLHDFIAAQSRYGMAEASAKAALLQLEGGFYSLLPDTAFVIYGLAIGSALTLLAARRWRSITLWSLLLCAFFCIAYSAATHKVAWDRTYGFMLVPAFLILAEVWTTAASWEKWPGYATRGGLALGLIMAFWGGLGQTREDHSTGITALEAYSYLGHDISQKLRDGSIPAEPAPFLVKPYSWDVNAYLPPDPGLHAFTPREGQPAQFLFMLEKPIRLKWFWLRTATWEEDTTNMENLPVEALGNVEYVLRQPLRAVVRKIVVPRAATATPPGGRVLGILVKPSVRVDRTMLLEWLSVQASEDFKSARVTVQNYPGEPTSSTLIFWSTPEWPASRWETALPTFGPTHNSTLWRLGE